MKKSITLAALVLVFAAPLARATCNTPGNQWYLAEQHLYDWLWSEGASCGAWHAVNGAERVYDVDECPSSLTLMSGYQARFKGDTSVAVRAWYQDITIEDNGFSSDPEVGFYVNVIGDDMSLWDVLRVTLRNPSTNAVIANVLTVHGNTSSNCGHVSGSVSGDYADQTVRVYFESTIWTGSPNDAFVIDAVTLHTYP